MTSIWELPIVYFQNLLLINNTPDNNLQPQMHICPLPCILFEQKLAESAYFVKTDSKLTQMTSIWELPNVYFQNLLLINNTPDNNLQPQMHICPLPCTLFEQKFAESAYFLNNWFQIDANDLNLRVVKCIFSKSIPHQQYTRQQPAIPNACLSSLMHTLWAKIGWVSLFCKNRF